MAPKGSTATEEKKPVEQKKSGKKDEKEGDIPEADLSEEDQALKDELDLCILRLTEDDDTLYDGALEVLRTKIRSATSSLTSVPKPLKFLHTHFDTICDAYQKMKESATKKNCADIISCMAMTMSEKRDCLKYKLVGTGESIGAWGHEYVRHLAGEISAEWTETISEKPDSDMEQLMDIVKLIVPYNMEHNAETDAVDLLMEIEKLDMLIEAVDEKTFKKTAFYLTGCVPYAPDPENTTLLKTALTIYKKFNRYAEAMRIALQLNEDETIEDIFLKCNDITMQKQLSYILGRQQRYLELSDDIPDCDDLQEIMSNSHLNTNFLALARELDIMEPKVPEDIYKSHLESRSSSQVDSARANLASSYVNGFVNCGFGQDKLLSEEGNKWIYKNKEHGMLAATASLGLILLWDVDGGLTQIDKYLYSSEDHIKAGSLLACGIVNSGVRTECDPALALLSDYVSHNTLCLRRGAALGLGIAYCGSNREDVINMLLPQLSDPKSNMEVIGVCALALGLICVGSCNGDVTNAILQTLITERSEADLKDSHARFLALALGLCYLQKQEMVETILAALQVVPEPLRQFANILVEVCAYAGTGNVLKIQQLLHICSEPPAEETEAKDDKKDQASKKKDKKEKSKEKKDGRLSQHMAAVVGIALIAMGEDIGSEMCFRSFGHLLRYGEPAVRRAVPLALALTSISNPQLHIIDTLSKFSHDQDAEVAYNSIFAMGLAGAGTNNARLAQMLRQLAVYYGKDANALFMVRLAQGLTHLGKGTLTLQPFHSDKSLLSTAAAAAIISAVVTCLDSKSLVLGKHHYLLYSLVPAIQPRLLVCFDEECQPLPVTVRVGQAVDVIGQAGKPKTITGFQTRTTPVLLSFGERAELATDEYIPLNPVLEGFVILKKNPNSIDAKK